MFKTPTVLSRRSFVRRSLPLMILPLLIAGCDGAGMGRLSRRTVEVSEIPEEVMGAAHKELPDVEFADAWKNLDKDGKLHSYEIRGRNKNGKIRELRVSPSGEILEVE
jgi:hypothetical protein